MAKIEHVAVFKAPIEKVFEFMNSPEKEKLYRPELIESEKTSEGPLGVGTTFREVTEFMGRRIETTAETTEYVLNKVSALKTTSGPIMFSMRATFEPVAEGTRVALEAEGEVGGFFKVAESVVMRMAKKQMETQFENLRKLLEEQK